MGRAGLSLKSVNMTRYPCLPIQMLGQSGCRLAFPGATVYLDPYLSNSVQILDSPDLDRLLPIPYPPEEVTDADFVCITHDHMDHCDPHTLPQLAQASPRSRFIGPTPVIRRLAQWGIASDRLTTAVEAWTDIAPNLRLRAVPAAHPEIERDTEGRLAHVGYLFEYDGEKIYFAGDTSVRQEIIDVLVARQPIHTAFLPVNEHNYFRAARGIIGNMSVREAFLFAREIGVRQVVAVHWDMFAVNAVEPEEIGLIYQRMAPGFTLLIRPSYLNLGSVRASIVIRTLNEARHLDELLRAVAGQQTHGLSYEVIVVDSGSTDDTLAVALRHGCRIHHIARNEFSFGRSLNKGCEIAGGEILVFISGHCIPTDEHWLQKLCRPILDGRAQYVYGRQLGGPESHYSECRIFAGHFPEQSSIPQEGFFCNNANAALLKSVWDRYRFDEELTGHEDMELAQRLVQGGGKVAYVAQAEVFHLHNETWFQIRRRFEREALALQKIMPQVHVTFFDTLRYVASSVWNDWRCSWRESGAVKFHDIVRYRWNQYRGSWKGNREHRKLSHQEKEKYFYPH